MSSYAPVSHDGPASPEPLDGDDAPQQQLTNPLRMPSLGGAPRIASPHDEETGDGAHSSAAPLPRSRDHTPREEVPRARPMPSSSPSGSDGDDPSSDGSHGALSPAHLLRPTALLIISCALVALSTINAVIGFAGTSGHECSQLAGFLLWTSLVSALTVPALHFLAHALQQDRERMARRTAAAVAAGSDPTAVSPDRTTSLSSTILYALLAVLCISTPWAIMSIDWLADGLCGRRRSVRQLALLDVVLLISIFTLLGLYKLLGRLPRRFTRQLNRSGGKSLALCVCLMALILNVTQLESHDEEWIESYHWGYSTRNPPCPHSCLAELSTALRHIVCRDSSGAEVEERHCSGRPSFHATHPSALVSMLQPCQKLPFAACKREYNGGAPMNGTGGGKSVLSTPIVQLRNDPECPKECVNYPPDYVYPGALDQIDIPLGCWREDEFINQVARGLPEPEGWVSLDQCEELDTMNVVNCPPRPCPAYCGPLEASSMTFACIYALAILALVASLFYARLKRMGLCRRLADTLDGGGAASSAAPSAASELDERIRLPASVMATPRFTVDDDDDSAGQQQQQQQHVHPQLPASAPAAAPSPDTDLPSVWRTLQLAVRALLAPGGWRQLRPWWRHVLFLLSVLLLLALLCSSLYDLLWLSQAHCRDFLVSTLLNCALTLVATLMLVALVLRSPRVALVTRELNPFESVGLLDEQGDSSAPDADDNHAPGEFGLSSPETAERRARRQLEQDGIASN